MSDDARARLRWLAPYVLLVVAGWLRLYNLGSPGELYFDEMHYVPRAANLWLDGFEPDPAMHPPLGKWLIGLGIRLLGGNAVAWRATAVIAGILTVLLVYAAGRHLFRRAGAALLAASLVSFDGVAFTMSRIGMLDAFLTLFVVAGFYFLVRSRGSGGAIWRVLCGIAFGCALATKWPAAAPLSIAVIAATAWELRKPRRRVLARVVVPLVVLPVALYVASYTPWFLSFERTPAAIEACSTGGCARGFVGVAGTWVKEQVRTGIMFFHLPQTHPGLSNAAAWPLAHEPLVLLRRTTTDAVDTLSVRGNPVLWWSATGATFLLAWRAIRRRDVVAALLVSFVLVQWLPWAMKGRGYLFYMLPVVPFLALMVGAVADHVRLRGPWRTAPVFVAVAAAAFFAASYADMTAIPLDPFPVVKGAFTHP